MDISTFRLFISCILFYGFNFYFNTRVQSERWLKTFTFLLGLIGLLSAGYLLLISLFISQT
jgi:hypothetical protein